MDDVGEGQQRLRQTESHTCACSCFKKGIETNRTSLFLVSFSFTAVLNWCFLKSALDAHSFWDYANPKYYTPALLSFMYLFSVFSFTTFHFSDNLSSLFFSLSPSFER